LRHLADVKEDDLADAAAMASEQGLREVIEARERQEEAVRKRRSSTLSRILILLTLAAAAAFLSSSENRTWLVAIFTSTPLPEERVMTDEERKAAKEARDKIISPQDANFIMELLNFSNGKIPSDSAPKPPPEEKK
jgi:hypothetical protein